MTRLSPRFIQKTAGYIKVPYNEQRFLQTEFWAEFKCRHGWSSMYFNILPDGNLKVTDHFSAEANSKNSLTLLIRRIKGFNLAYIPMAPEYSDEDREDYLKRVSELAKKIKPLLPKRTLFMRFDVPVDFTDLTERESFAKDKINPSLGIKKSAVDIQPPDTVLLDINPTEEEILAAMKSKWRYNIRLAEKKDVKVSRHFAGEEGFEEAFNNFYSLFEQTSKRDGVSFHGKGYYMDLLQNGKPDGSGKPKITLYLAKHENDYLAGIITLFCPREAVYLYGASGNIKRNLMPAYLLQWTAIKDAKEAGCPVYDFYGCPPTDDENHPMHGLFLFKTGFGGTLIHRPGSFDIPLSPLYGLYNAAEKLRAWWFKKAMKKIGRR
ncbi:MAG: peptidoglycan bridge formation glycyltransferase FemA/FemB family protein [Treponema sp.]|nr:peptidoglycan bridge formation glycyltransferase FemA/FemB family protein [Treponema sp.]